MRVKHFLLRLLFTFIILLIVVFKPEKKPKKIYGENKVVEEQGMVQLSDPAKLQPLIDEAIAANPGSVEDYKNGKDRALGFFVGQIMKQTRGKANPQVVNKLILETLANM